MWYVIQVMSGREHHMAELCRMQDMQDEEEVFVPLYQRKKKIKGEWKMCEAILFPGYVFFDTKDVQQLYYRLKKVSGLTKILATGNEFTPLHETEIAFLKQFGGKKHIVEMSVGYIEGDTCTVTTGPMQGFSGVIKKIDRHKKIAVLEVEFFGRNTEVTVGLEIVSKSADLGEKEKTF